MTPLCTSCFHRAKFSIGGSVLAFFLASACGALAGTWSSRQWTNDGDIPQPAPELVTHALAFGLEAEPPVPAPFELTQKISGEKWAVWQLPKHTAEVFVDRRGQSVLSAIKTGEEGFALLQGRILPKKPGGLALELSGLDPGRNYSLVIFGLGFASAGGRVITVSASDAPGQSEDFKQAMTGSDRFFAYDYTAPPDGKITVSFESSASNKGPQTIRFCAFLNQLAE